MKNSPTQPARNSSEHGGAGVKFLIIVLVLFLIGHAGYIYIPSAYQSEDYKQRMNELVTNAFAMPNSPLNSPEVVKQRLRNYGNDYGVPANALIKVDKMDTGALRAQVKFSKEIDILPFHLYKYNYEFEHIAMPNGFLTKQ
ncbi:MAG TPA: hypothetical protein VF644_04700 [Pyrinomonadaceae bacterium]|jgi:hypothetical protein